ncbi:hypothetical protein [Micromonospora matsumotoense]|uniref:hypothetical protein n=1 Tax=Micromonospora matsumotoense TaxID=121616 RepID=UPI00340485F3
MDEEPRTRDWLPRTAALLFGTLVLATAFIAAYVGALHQPHPRDVPVGVVTGDQRAEALLTAVRARTGTIEPIGYADPGAADDALTARQVYAVLTSAPDGTLTLATASASASAPASASASAPAATELVTQVLTPAARQAQLPLTVLDQVPVSPDHPRGLVPFYLGLGPRPGHGGGRRGAHRLHRRDGGRRRAGLAGAARPAHRHPVPGAPGRSGTGEEWDTSIVGKVTHRTPFSRTGPRGYHPGSRTALSFVLT